MAYRTVPGDTTGMPPGVPYIIGNEFAERYSFYGMKAILFTFMTEYLVGADGSVDPMTGEEATQWFHNFSAAVYATPFLGAILSDAFLGKYRTILAISSVYCVGHLALSLDETRIGLALGLGLIALGAGGIKPCVSAHVGDQFGRVNQDLLERVFSWFYFAINFGAVTSMMLAPWMLHEVGPWLAFGVPGVLMVLATFAFWMGRNRFVHIQPTGREFAREVFSPSGLMLLRKLLPLVAFFGMFWALFDQTGSTWIAQGKRLDTEVFGYDLYAEQLQALNPLLVMLFIPTFSYGLYPLFARFFQVTALRKIGIGFFVMVPAFLIPAWIEAQLDAGLQPSILWQVPGYVVLTAAEIMVSVTGLELFYTQAPNRMKSFVMSIYMAAVAVGNLFTSLVNTVIQSPDGTSKLAGPNYYLFFAGLMLVTAVLFVFYTRFFEERRHVQGDSADDGLADATNAA